MPRCRNSVVSIRSVVEVTLKKLVRIRVVAPEDEIGSHSVMPWTAPRIAFWIRVSILE